MTIATKWCSVVHGHVTVVSTLEGEVTSVVCPDYEESTRKCRLKDAALTGGPLTQLLGRVEVNTLARPTVVCDLAC